MRRLPPAMRGPLAVAIVLILGIAVALPVLAASPSPSGASPTGNASGNGNGNGKGPKASHEPEVQVTLNGTVAATTDPGGSADYTLTANGKTLHLEAGPKWFWGDRIRSRHSSASQ